MADLKENTLQLIEEKEFISHEKNTNWAKYRFIRVIAKKIEFENVNFSFTHFEDCYFRNCKFIRCKFKGTKFKSSILRGSEFKGCEFDYSDFSSTIIDLDQISKNLPSHENIRRELARNLKKNFIQIGDSDGVNFFVTDELLTTKHFLRKASFSYNDTYYAHKYRGLKKLSMFFRYCKFIFFDFLWGNGESILKLTRSMVIIIILSSISGYLKDIDFKNTGSFYLYFEYLKLSAVTFFSSYSNHFNFQYSEYHILMLVFSRYIAIGLFISVVTKRLSRR
ncbi:MAG: pentapeptide repeat-containing protein [Bacteroidetes bacterium]|nr:pentapeptide repeat-containing protein [Bacteroidota bacterium]